MAQKCDAKRPCTTCIVAKTVSECVYDGGKHPQPACMDPSYRADGRQSWQQPTGPHLVETPAATSSRPLSDGTFTNVRSPAELDRIPYTSSDSTWAVTDEPATQGVFEADQVLHRELVLTRRNQLEQCVPPDISPSAFTIPSISLPTMPSQLRTSLSHLGKEKLQVQFSKTAVTDLDMKSCVSEWDTISHKLTLRH
jgi:hypothetical protein